MRHQLLIIVALLFTFSLAEAKKEIKLFNQKNLSGWYAYNETSGKQTKAANLFTVDEHMIRMYGKEAGYLMSKKTFQNFKLTAIFRWNNDENFERKNNKKNSGLMYLVPSTTPDALWPKGIQFQIKEGATGDFVLLKEITITKNNEPIAPGKSVVVKGDAKSEKPAGEWNTIIITVKNGKITQTLNDVVVNEATNPSVESGRILLQYEGYPIDFKQLSIQKL